MQKETVKRKSGTRVGAAVLQSPLLTTSTTFIISPRSQREWPASGSSGPPAAGIWLPKSSNSSLNYEGWGMAASLITMTDCPSVGISQMVIVGCVGYKEKEEVPLLIGLPPSFFA